MSNIVVETSWRGRIEEFLGRRRETWTVALVLGAAGVLALVLWMRGAPAQIAPPATPPPSGPGAVAPSATALIYVDVAGAVRAPGLYSLPAGARVADALTAARGPRSRANLSTLNLAQVLADGMKIVVPVRGAPSREAQPPATQPSSDPVVSLNGADQAALETVPGIGPVTALAILTYRERIGVFESIDQLLEVDGIGPATLEQIRPYVSI